MARATAQRGVRWVVFFVLLLISSLLVPGALRAENAASGVSHWAMVAGMNAATKGVEVETSPLPVKEACPQVRRKLQVASSKSMTVAVAALGALAAMAWGGMGSHAASAVRRKGFQRLWFGTRRSLASGRNGLRFRDLRKIVSGRTVALCRTNSWGDLKHRAANAHTLRKRLVIPLYAKSAAIVPSTAAIVSTALATAVQNAVYVRGETSVLPSIQSNLSAFCGFNEDEEVVSTQSPWMACGTAWRRRFENDELSVMRKDAGGGGDCLFHSVSLGLAGGGLKMNMMDLRRLAADAAAGLDGCDPNATLVDASGFTDRLSVMAALEGADEWQDGWSPREIQDSDTYTASNGATFDTSTLEGKARAVHLELRSPGSNHWGTAADICSLEDMLDVGILVMEHETGRLQPTASVYSKKRRGYLFVYFIGGVHFQLAGFVDQFGVKSFFKPEEVPPALLRVVKEDTRQDLFPGAAAAD